MSAVTALMRGRTAAEALMIDSVTITRLASSVTDGETGVVTPTYTVIYSGKAKIQRTGRQTTAHPTDVGEAEVFMSRLEVHIPTSETGASTDDIVTVDASPLDPELPGQRFHIRQEAHKSFQTARRLGVEEITS
jgi:hypothetical protein